MLILSQELLWGYLRSVAPKLDRNTLNILVENIRTIGACPARNSLLKQLADISDLHEGVSNATTKSNEGRLSIPLRVWKRRVQALVQEVIFPENLSWMDDDVDDDALGISNVCKRALFEIHSRFEQYVFFALSCFISHVANNFF